MAITMQGSWTLRATARQAAYAQRFIVSGADIGDGVYDGVVGKRVFVSGAQWELQVQHRLPRQGWRDSAQRLGLPAVRDGLLRVEVGANDGGLDELYDDLVLSCSLPISEAEHVVYGEVTRHDGHTPFNPRRDDYLVIDAPLDLPSLHARHPTLMPVIEALYPQRFQAPAGAVTGLSPLVVPNGLPHVAVGLRFASRAVEPKTFGADEELAVEALQACIGRVPFQAFAMKAGADALSSTELCAVARVRDEVIRHSVDAKPAPGLTLRFQRYHQTPAEAAGAAYQGAGLREELGWAVSDEQGRYLFRFRLPRGHAHPDLVVQVAGAGRPPSFETAPYDRVANLRRIDLCVPERACALGSGHGVTAAAERPPVFEYVGATSLTVVGPASGRCYRFGGPGASLFVDQRDRETLAHIRSLRVRQAA
ncbi:MAG: hypothetical protein KF891_21280 [Rhizobacter sp.]|nr:hypothetical protein [Rhizobacter sp.]